MSTIIENYIPSEGIMVFSDGGYQRVTSVYNGGFNYRSRINQDIDPTNNSVSDCWESGNIYYIENNDVYKMQYNGTPVVSLSIGDAISIAAIQAELPMSRNPSTFRQDSGCWIVRGTAKELIKTDNLLSSVAVLTNLLNPVKVISSDVDQGCYLFDDGLQWVMKVNTDAEVESYLQYNFIQSGLALASEIKRSMVDHTGSLWILTDRFIYKFLLSGGQLFKVLTLNPLSLLGYTQYNSFVSDFDIDRDSSAANVYVAGGCRNRSWIIKYDLNGLVVDYKKNIGIEHPVSIKVTQFHESTGVYIITEDDPDYIPVECDTSSSSTSSSSSYGYSSSSSTSSSSESDGIPCCDGWEIHFPDPSYDFIFSIWDIYGMNTINNPPCRVWAEFLSAGQAVITQTINLYDNAIKSIENLIATGSKDDNVTGDITLSEVDSSGVSGTVVWYEQPAGTHPNNINYPNSLFELTCAESSSSSSSTSNSSSSSEGYSSSSSSEGYSSSSSSSFEIYDCEGLVCSTPIGGSANACSVLTDWVIDGTTNTNTKQGSMVVQIYHNGAPTESPPSTYKLDVYKADEIGPTPLGPLVATSGDFTWTSLLPRVTTFSGNGISGQVTWSGYTGSAINENYTLITCSLEMSSSSSSSSTTSETSESLGSGVFTATGFDTYPECNGQYYYSGPGYLGSSVYTNENGIGLAYSQSWGVLAWKINDPRYIRKVLDPLHPEGIYTNWFQPDLDPNARLVRNY